jgi:hypothetical protein
MATGKARGRWVGMMRKQMGLEQEGWTLNGPGVFIQGLLVCNEQVTSDLWQQNTNPASKGLLVCNRQVDPSPLPPRRNPWNHQTR